MNLRQFLRRFRGAHWSVWVLWAGCMGLLGLMYVNVYGFESRVTPIRDLAEHFRYPWGMLPIEIVALRNLGEATAWTVGISMAFVAAALIQPEKGALSMSLAIGVIVLFFAVHASLFVLTTLWSMKALARERGASAVGPPAPAATGR